DSSPIPEVEAAVLAGLGWRGKNGQLLTEGYGSLCFLCEVVTDLALGEVVDQPPKSVPDSCGSCTRCLDSCPTGALSLNGLDKTRCRSFITQKKGALSDWERDQIQAGGLAWGCDICTMACPRNRHPVLSTVAALREHPVPRLTAETVAPLLSQKSYGWRGSGVLLRNLAILNDSERE
ncbi:MAG: 4Fe-4S double cluster binding domain-containing protein, partial [Angelakisella sp.]